MADELHWHSSRIKSTHREVQNAHRSRCVWLTGLSGSGKSTLAVELERVLFGRGVHTYVLDGDNIRHGLNSDLGFTDEDRRENIRRLGEVAKLFVDAGIIAITAFISPFREDRARARGLFEKGRFIEIYVDCDLETCRRRDPKGLYAKAEQGRLENFTGISSTYEPPINPELILKNSDEVSIQLNVERVVRYLEDTGVIPRGA